MSRPLILAISLLLALAANAAPVKTEHVEAELFAERTAAQPGKPALVGLRLRMAENWHTYWKNPGDSGLPTRIKWSLPEGWTAGPILWPHPEAQPIGPLMNYGYSDEVMLLTELTPPANVRAGPAAIRADADWLVCKDVCVPEKGSLALAFAVTEGNADADSRTAAHFERARSRLPVTLAGWTAESAIAGSKLQIRFTPPPGSSAPGRVQFFPERENFVEHAAPQVVTRDGAAVRVEMQLVEPVAANVKTVAGVLVAQSQWPGTSARKAVDFSATLGAPLPAAKAPEGMADEIGGSLAAALLFALAGGVLLNLMPCVFPVLGIKVMGFVRHAHGDARALWLQGAIFSAGVVFSFLLLAGLMLALREGGTQLGWGFQLQSPAFVVLLAALFFLMALNLFGVFEWGGFAQSMTSSLSAQGRYTDAFLAGALATLVATPCTAPFMGAAVGYTLAQPAAVSLAIFATIGVGMALPVLALSFFPNALKRLPRPGPWMETFKQVMAFPLFATVIWLAWVIGNQAGNDATLALLAGLLLVGIGAWVHGRWAHSQSFWRHVIAAVLAAAGLWLAWPGDVAQPAGARVSTARAGEIPWQPWSPEKLAELRAAGTPVFVDFTAAWCVTCQVNKRVAFNKEAVVNAFAARGVAPLKADWTNNDPRITAALADLGRNALPVYVLYAPGKTQPKLLPEVLTSSIVIDELSRLPALTAQANPASTQR